MAAVSGLEPGQVVSTTGFDKLEDGSLVKVEDTGGSEQVQPATNSKSTASPASSL
jgi:hypothetical protein